MEPVTEVWCRDETLTGRELARVLLSTLSDRISVRELIRLRVREEVARHNADPGGRFRGLVQPVDAEVELNGYRLRTPRRLDWEVQAEAALRAFRGNGFILLVGDRQVDDLDEEIDLTTDPDIAFVKLVPLVGG